MRLVTWNLWWRFGDEPQRRRRAIEQVLADLDADVICLQETDPASGQLDDLAARLGGWELAAADARLANAVLSRWPIVERHDCLLPARAGGPAYRHAVAAVLDTPAGPWPVVSTHLDHRFDESALRVEQADELCRFVAELRGDIETAPPVLVGADLNAVPDSDEVRRLTGRSAPPVPGLAFSDAWEQVGQGPGWTWRGDHPRVGDSAWPDRRLDYVLVSWPRPKPLGNPVSARLVGDRPVELGDGDAACWPSDHLGLLVELVGP